MNAEHVARRLATWVEQGEGRAVDARPCGGHRLPWRAVLWEGRHAVADCRGSTEADAVANALTVAMALAEVEPSVYEAVAASARALLVGATLQADEVTAGRGALFDWRTVSSGELLLEGCDAYEVARLFVALVGPSLAMLEAQTKALPPWQQPEGGE